jgi:predicted Zn-dependent protease
MSQSAKILTNTCLTRREFLWMVGLSSVAFAAGCSTNPVTGKSQLMLVSENEEISLDLQQSPHQFSGDYGQSQDRTLNNYIDQVGKGMVPVTHRPHMPYSFHVVNATYVNAYAFPGGSIAATRGIMINLENEAELAALLGHELGHVNARHTAERMSKGMVTEAVVGGVAILAGTQSAALGELASSLGQVGAGAFLAFYSRENERQADDLGMEYMVKSGYSPEGFIGLMDMLQNISKHQPSAIELMFATHPMSDERYQTSVDQARHEYASANTNAFYRERYMDNTANLRSIRGAIEAMQQGEKAMGRKSYDKAENHFKKALRIAPNDYAGLLMMAKCQMIQDKYEDAKYYSEKAKRIYPQEAQANHLAGLAKIHLKRFDEAYEDFSRYDRLLPGNPNILFFKGYALEGMQRIQPAAKYYGAYLQSVQQGEMAQYANQRLVKWGYGR